MGRVETESLRKGSNVLMTSLPFLTQCLLPLSLRLRLRSKHHQPSVAMHQSSTNHLSDAVVPQQKRALRSKIRKDLKAMPPAQRRDEDAPKARSIAFAEKTEPMETLKHALGTFVMASFHAFTSAECYYLKFLPFISSQECPTQTKKKIYVPWVEDKNSHMRMLNITTMEDLIANSMNILEPAPTDSDGNQREDAMQATDPVDLLLIPGLAFDKSGRRLGRGGGYYDVFLKKYQDLVAERKWKQPLLVALSYSLQIVDEGVIPVTPSDVPVDALISPAGMIPISPAALERM